MLNPVDIINMRQNNTIQQIEEIKQIQVNQEIETLLECFGGKAEALLPILERLPRVALTALQNVDIFNAFYNSKVN